MKFLKKSNLYQHFAKEKFPNQQTRVPFEKKNDIVICKMNFFQYKLKFLEQFSKCKVQNDINAWFFFIFCNKTEYVSWKYKLCKTFCILIKAALRFLTIINLVLLILRIPPWNDNHSELWLSDYSFIHNIKFMEKSQT